MGVSKKAPEIGTLNEGALHAALKRHYGGAEAQFEVPFSGFVADVVRDDTIFEIQTSSFSGLERKMRALADQNPVVLVHPIAAQKNLVRIKDPASGDFTRRKSPKKGKLCHILSELVYLPSLLNHPNFSVEVALIEEEQHSIYDPKARRGRGGWRTRGRHLVELLEQCVEVAGGPLVLEPTQAAVLVAVSEARGVRAAALLAPQPPLLQLLENLLQILLASP